MMLHVIASVNTAIITITSLLTDIPVVEMRLKLAAPRLILSLQSSQKYFKTSLFAESRVLNHLWMWPDLLDLTNSAPQEPFPALVRPVLTTHSAMMLTHLLMNALSLQWTSQQSIPLKSFLTKNWQLELIKFNFFSSIPPTTWHIQNSLILFLLPLQEWVTTSVKIHTNSVVLSKTPMTTPLTSEVRTTDAHPSLTLSPLTLDTWTLVSPLMNLKSENKTVSMQFIATILQLTNLI